MDGGEPRYRVMVSHFTKHGTNMKHINTDASLTFLSSRSCIELAQILFMAAPQHTNAESALIPNVTAISPIQTVAQQMQLIQEQIQANLRETQASFDQM